MKRMPRPILWWSSDERGSDILNGVPTNKEVWLHAENVRQPTPFQIRRRTLFSRIPGFTKSLLATYVIDVPTVDLGNGVLRSRGHWQAAEISLSPSSSDYFFLDGNGSSSGILTVSNTPTFRWQSARRRSGIINPELMVPFGQNGLETKYAKGTLFNYSDSFEYVLEGSVIAPEDPGVELVVLTPEARGNRLLNLSREVLSFELKDLVPDLQRRYITSALEHLRGFSTGPSVEFTSVQNPRFEIAADEMRSFGFSIRDREPTRMLFAVEVRNLDTNDISISEFMPVVIERR